MSLRSRKKRAHRAKRQPLSKAMMALVIVLVIFGVGGIAAAAAAMVWLQDLPDYKDSSAFNYAEKTSVYANDGTTLLAEFYIENRDPVELSEMSQYVLEGTVATEDERFYEHDGVDMLGIARAIVVNLTGTGKEALPPSRSSSSVIPFWLMRRRNRPSSARCAKRTSRSSSRRCTTRMRSFRCT